MICPRRLPASLVLAVLVTMASKAHASGPAGVWGIVDEVKLTPNESNPQTMRIDGLFMIANQDPDFAAYPGYSVPQYGYIYYTCLEKQLVTCAMEWKELLALAGTADNCRGWGDNSFEINGTVRPANEPMVEEQEVYPVSMGIMTGITPCDALEAWMTRNPDPDTDGSTGEPGSTGDSSTTGSSESTGETGASTSGEPSTGATTTTTDGTTGAPGTTESNDSTISDTAVPLTTATPTDGGDAGDSSGTTGTTTTAPGEDTDKGCSCDGDTRPPGPAALLVLAGLALIRRRRSA